MLDIWIWVHHRDHEIEDLTYGLVAEAKRLITKTDQSGRVTAVALGPAPDEALESLGAYGVDRVFTIDHEQLNRYQGELFGQVLFELLGKEQPTILLMAQASETEDLAQRVAAMMKSALITRTMDFSLAADGTARAIRPVANGYLFEELEFNTHPPPVVLFLPAVLFEPEPEMEGSVSVTRIPFADSAHHPKTRAVKVIEAAPEELDLEEADIIVAGGRGVGKGESFEVVHALARAVGGSVGGTRPIIDWGDLPYERQIGQTGKYVAPRLIINCGISGANEYTAGMEKSLQVIAIDRNPRVRMFRFADLGVVGDVHEILPLLISRIEGRK
ncbi:MAG: electron transfer flavoprotein subunit alpha/FixB family protein [Desulfobacterales bacterium]